MIRKILLLLTLNLIIISNLSASPKIEAKTAILMDYNSGKILHELEPDMSIYPASMTKIMTAIVAFDLLKQDKLKLDDEFIVSEGAWRMSKSGYSSMFIMLNDKVSVEDLLRGIIVASGNDACVALAEGIAGSESNFAEMMNEKAEEIGLTNTNFTNSSGLNDPDNYSTVRDIALMSEYLIRKFPKYYEYFKEKEFTWDRTGGDPITQGNRNPLLYKSIGADGIKTGYLAVEKYSLAATIKGEERRLISVVSGFQTKQKRSNETFKYINWGFRNTNTYKIAEKNIPKFDFDVWLGKENKVLGYSKEDLYLTISKKNLKDIKVTLKYTGPLKAPVNKDQEIGTLFIEVNEEERKIPIYSSEEVKKVNFIKSLFLSFNYMIWGDV
ncbi:MAG: D-alanyl-D-alanine carboxypeptidase [Candidatus Marinimicrobia bacterium]|nr:D-alanyl-D-alanine carboxypeptidase [Candidatus Neomarinimicrobiota bacterium]|tara:strand:- start:6375 stop:7523 length:1149 start_codon:yes stop_codon:yes gene_type:complete